MIEVDFAGQVGEISNCFCWWSGALYSVTLYDIGFTCVGLTGGVGGQVGRGSLIITATQGSEIVAKSRVEKIAVSGFLFSRSEQQVSGGFGQRWLFG